MDHRICIERSIYIPDPVIFNTPKIEMSVEVAATHYLTQCQTLFWKLNRTVRCFDLYAISASCKFSISIRGTKLR
ncbi:hypothetical protein RJT34_20034 [Clitoria ternatea]|uniref:Uncharacterized protein n=1 Tax=Clitoria ternatea TaxID=43366 RepID=A0AAN9IS98_CLITE